MNQYIGLLLLISAITWGCEEAVSNHDGPSPAYYGPCGAAVPDGGLLKYSATPIQVLDTEHLKLTEGGVATLTVHNIGAGNLLLHQLRVEPEDAYGLTWTYAEHPEYGPRYEPICVGRDEDVQVMVRHVRDGLAPDGTLQFRTNAAEHGLVEIPITGR